MRRTALGAAVCVYVAATACLSQGHDRATSSDDASQTRTSHPRTSPPAPRTDLSTRTPRAAVTVLAGDGPAAVTLATSRALLDGAPTVVIARASDPASQRTASAAALRLHAPLLLAGIDDGALRDELDRLGTRSVLTVGLAAQAFETRDRTATEDRGTTRPHRAVPANDRTARPSETVALTSPGAHDLAAQTTARAAGATVQVSRGSDVRADTRTSAALKSTPRHVVVLGDTFGSAADASYTVAAARRGLELPGGGQVVFPGRRMVALYGHPGTPSLGVLGEQHAAKAIRRAKRVARPYARLEKEPVIPTFELIATVASGSKGKDGNYSNEARLSVLRPWVEAAHRAGMYVVLDLQPGKSSFVAQAKRYGSLLELPYVGLALDSEWRLKPKQRPLHQIGSVDVSEVNAVAGWLAALTRRHALPQKVLVLHQFQQQMIRHRSRLDMSHPELAVVIHADGQGPQGAKRGTWRTLRKGAPRGVFWGWKNFYDEDHPTLSPKKTYAVRPRPDFVSYQ